MASPTGFANMWKRELAGIHAETGPMVTSANGLTLPCSAGGRNTLLPPSSSVFSPLKATTSRPRPHPNVPDLSRNGVRPNTLGMTCVALVIALAG